jgi:glucokinase
MYLAGDIGGTKTILALFSAETGPRNPIVETRFPSSDYAQLELMVADFLEQNAALLAENPIAASAFGLAGPVNKGRSQITNLRWVVEQSTLAYTIGIPHERVRLLNDLEATATAVPYLTDEDLHTINVGEPVAHSPIAVIAPGTGLGQAFLTWDGDRYRAHASEGGHTDFAPGDRLQLELLNYLSKEYEHVSMERVCSGLGIPNIYRFLRDELLAVEPAWLAEAISQATDPVPIIMENAADPEKAEPICRKTLDMFVAILGAEVGNVALTLLARGGVYLGGGIPPRIIPALEGLAFIQYVRNKGRFRPVMEQIPIHVIKNAKTGLLGAAYGALALDQ